MSLFGPVEPDAFAVIWLPERDPEKLKVAGVVSIC